MINVRLFVCFVLVSIPFSRYIYATLYLNTFRMIGRISTCFPCFAFQKTSLTNTATNTTCIHQLYDNSSEAQKDKEKINFDCIWWVNIWLHACVSICLNAFPVNSVHLLTFNWTFRPYRVRTAHFCASHFDFDCFIILAIDVGCGQHVFK